MINVVKVFWIYMTKCRITFNGGKMNYCNINEGYEWGNFILVYLKKKQFCFC